MEEKNIIAIEIGSSKVRGAIGSYNSQGVLTVHAVEEEPMLNWVRYGAVLNVEEVGALVSRIIRKIENRVSPRKVETVYVSIGGRSFCSMSREVEKRFAEDTDITDAILRQLLGDAEQTPLGDRITLGVEPRGFFVDKLPVQQPKGTVGQSIRMQANLITCRAQTRKNLDRLFNDKLKLKVGGYEVRQLALANMVLTSEEKSLGCMLVDFGAETTTVSIYKQSRLQYMSTIPLGSRNITRDITKLHYMEERAEELKCSVGNAQGITAESMPIGGTDYTALNNYVSHRAAEIIANIKKQLEYADFKASDLPAGIIIVGGGARLAGFIDRLQNSLTMKVRTGNMSTAQVRIADGRISQDAVDVVSVMLAAARHGAVECLTTPVVVEQPYIEPEPEYEEPERTPEEEIEIEEDAPSAPKKKVKWIEAIKNRMANLMSESEDLEGESDENVMRDDD